MKKILRFALCPILLCMAQVAFAQTANGIAVDTIINRHLAALGGKEKLNALQTIYAEGSLHIKSYTMNVRINSVRDKLYRADIEMAGVKAFVLNTDTGAWKYIPVRMDAPMRMPDSLSKVQNALLDISPLLNYKEKGSTVTFLAKDTVQGAECYKLLLTPVFGKTTTVWIDTRTYLVNQYSISKADGSESFVIYSDYRMVDGLMFPFKIDKQSGGGEMAGLLTLSKIVINPVIDPKLYRPE
jgi:outer membrane lipoprotein-sorting protein